MINRIYQFADIPIILGNQAVFYNQNTQWQGTVGSYTHTYKKWANNHRFVHEPTEISFTGRMVYDGVYPPEKLVQKLRSYVGLPESLICYVLPNDYPEEFNNCMPCQDCADCEIQWITAPAILSGVDTDKGDYEAGFNVTITFKLLNFFSGLNPLLWVYDGGMSDYAKEVSIYDLSSINCFPSCEQMYTAECIGCKFFSRRNVDSYDLTFNALLWRYLEDNACCDNNFFESSPFNPDGAGLYGYYFQQESAAGRIFFNKVIRIDETMWGAPPSSIHKLKFFKSVPGAPIVISGGAAVMTITVESRQAGKVIYDNVAIDLTDIQTKVTALTGVALKDGDEIIVGDFNAYDAVSERFYRGAFLQRNGSIVPFLFPIVEYYSYAPGQLLPGYNKITVTAHAGWVNGDYGLIYSFIHNYRRV